MQRTPKWILGTSLIGLLLSCRGSEITGNTYQELLDSSLQAGLIGVALTVDGPGVHFDGTAGFADRDQQVLWRPEHLFRIASNSKTFLGVLAAQLAEEGLLDLDAPLSDYVSAELVNRIENAESATVRQALNHTSGIYDYLDSDGFSEACSANPSRVWTPEDALTYAFDEASSFSPGEDWEYSNSNYLLAGLALDAVLGHAHAVEMQQRIFTPLSLNATFYEHQQELEGELVHGYAIPEDGDSLFDFYAFDQGYGMADGGLVATASDLARFIAAVGEGTTLLSSQARSLMFGQMIALDDSEQYGLGVSLLETPYGEAVGHGGGLDGYTSEMFYFKEKQLSIVLFTNISGDDEEKPFYDLLEAVKALALQSSAE